MSACAHRIPESIDKHFLPRPHPSSTYRWVVRLVVHGWACTIHTVNEKIVNLFVTSSTFIINQVTTDFA